MMSDCLSRSFLKRGQRRRRKSGGGLGDPVDERGSGPRQGDMKESEYVRYLNAKSSVDDRALNESVLRALRRALSGHAQQSNEDGGEGDRPLRALEVGGGVGAMIFRLCRLEVFAREQRVEYDLVDIKIGNLRSAEALLERYADDGVEWQRPTAADLASAAEAELDGGINAHHKGAQVASSVQLHALARLRCCGVALSVRLLSGDGLQLVDSLKIADHSDQRYDLVVSAAFLDLFPVSSTLLRIAAALKVGGLLYAPINFDGVTHFAPYVGSVEGECTDDRRAAVDVRVEGAFHDAMNTTERSFERHDRTGRLLMSEWGSSSAFSLLTAGASSWVVTPQQESYHEDEAFFLHCILTFIGETLGDGSWIDAAELQRYIAIRRRQVDQAQLCYLAHNMDYLAQRRDDE